MSATVTPAQNAYNLRTARQRVAAQLGVNPSNLEYSERITYNRTLAGIILSYPAGFTDAQLATAATVAGRDYPTLADPSFDWSQFNAQLVDNAGSAAAGLVSWLPRLAVVAILGALAFWILPGAFARSKEANA